MSDENTTVTALRRARAFVEKPECWGKGIRRYRLGTYCVVEAFAAVTEFPYPNDPVQRAQSIFAKVIKRHPSGFVAWNDVHVRTHPEILAAFDRAIELAEAQP